MENSQIDTFIRKINSFNNVKYNYEDKTVDIICYNENTEIDSFFLKGPLDLVGYLERQKIDYSLFFKKILLRELKLTYYSNCLYKYIFQILDENKSHLDTCWGSVCEKTLEIGKIPKNSNNLRDLIENYCKKNNFNSNLIKTNDPNLIIVDGWVKYIDNNDVVRNNFYKKFKKFIKKVIFQKKFDRSIDLLKKIRKEGFNEKKFNANESNLNVVAGYSSKTKNYMIFHGKHRIAVLKYLQSKGEIDNKFEISIPFLRYNFNHFKQSAPGMQCKCKI